MSDNRLLVPVSQSPTLRQTVEYAVDIALDDAGEGYLQFVYVHSTDRAAMESAESPQRDSARELLNRVSVWAKEDAGGTAESFTVETAQIGMDEYLFSPVDVARELATHAHEQDIHHVVFDPEYDPGIGMPLLRPLEYELTRFPDLSVEEAPVTARTRRSPLVVRSTPVQVGSLFFVSFVFYQLLAGQLYWFDLVTGAVSATVVAVGLSRVTFHRDPSVGTLGRIARLVVYVPYLLVEIIKANVLIAAVILHPRLPIDPRMTRLNTAVWGGLPVTTLANSITLTPGTLSVRVDGRSLKVHTLVPAAREDLFDGGLERAVRFVFYGRDSMQISSPRERGDAEILQDATADLEETPAPDLHDPAGSESPSDGDGGERE